MSYSWDRRSGTTGTTVGVGSVQLGACATGHTIIRTIAGWHFGLTVQAWAFYRIVGQPVFVGVQTVLASHVGSLPDPSLSPLAELGFPLQRWLWFEQRELEVVPGQSLNAATAPLRLRAGSLGHPPDTETQAKNTSGSSALNVWLTVSVPACVDFNTEGTVWANGSVLVS